ncbi:hypothetical protein FSW04_00715 [Baekduia soli]|uniref:Uncharacterized protein n=1 Tax=Baekduia soli TaxID=496014 RepID=A0A5B8TZT0_9ACTN|nr:hypothetical protein [Baekduia soli]QEC46237.1 hypothetical protein FSW04_00715 [Baekduia soli]
MSNVHTESHHQVATNERLLERHEIVLSAYPAPHERWCTSLDLDHEELGSAGHGFELIVSRPTTHRDPDTVSPLCPPSA